MARTTPIALRISGRRYLGRRGCCEAINMKYFDRSSRCITYRSPNVAQTLLATIKLTSHGSYLKASRDFLSTLANTT